MDRSLINLSLIPAQRVLDRRPRPPGYNPSSNANSSVSYHTLRTWLTGQRPPPLCDFSDTLRLKAQWVAIEQIVEWTDFTLDNLNNAYGDVLEMPMGPETTANPALAIDVITSEEQFVYLADRNINILQVPLDIASMHRHGHRVGQESCSPVIRFPDRPEPPHPQIKPQHEIYVHPLSSSYLIEGVICPHLKIQARAFFNPRITSVISAPLRKLATLCYLRNTRYGYLELKRDVVFCRFSWVEPPPQKQTTEKREKVPIATFNVEVMSVSTASCGESFLTADLGRWWITMMALDRGDRAIVPRREESLPGGVTTGGGSSTGVPTGSSFGVGIGIENLTILIL